MSEVIVVNVPDKKEALYIDGALVVEASWISAIQLLDKLVHKNVVSGGRRYAEESALNDVGQFPRNLTDLAIRDKRFPAPVAG